MGLLTSRLARCLGAPPPGVGCPEDGLAPCPDAPRCVSSLAQDKRHWIAPIRYTGSRGDARTALLDAIRALARAHSVTVTDCYVHATQRSRWFGFVDDVECLLPAGEPVIHLRSSARIGYYDFGVNRARIERLRRMVQDRLAKPVDGDP